LRLLKIGYLFLHFCEKYQYEGFQGNLCAIDLYT
jgi:hypothetical protein